MTPSHGWGSSGLGSWLPPWVRFALSLLDHGAQSRCHELPGPPVTHLLAGPSRHWGHVPRDYF